MIQRSIKMPTVGTVGSTNACFRRLVYEEGRPFLARSQAGRAPINCQPIARREVPADQLSGSGVLSIRATHFGAAVFLLPGFILIAAPHGRRAFGASSLSRSARREYLRQAGSILPNSNVHVIVDFDARLFGADDGNDRAMIVLRIPSYLSFFASLPAKILACSGQKTWLRN